MIQDPFRSMIRSEGVLRYRDLPWRRTRDPYIIWLSEVMLQQTQVPRVEARMPVWLDRFPTVLLRRDVQRGIALLVRKETGAGGEELDDAVIPPQLTGNVESRRAVLVRRVHIRAVFEEILDQVRRLR